jgi:hypothetical protein
MDKLIRNILENIHEYVNVGRSYAEKRDALFADATDDERMSLDEFLSWFPEDEEDASEDSQPQPEEKETEEKE